jgi:chromate transport protein ChrA
MTDASVSLAELARVFFRIGWLAFGGPVAQLGLIHDECVERRRWLDDEQFVADRLKDISWFFLQVGLVSL